MQSAGIPHDSVLENDHERPVGSSKNRRDAAMRKDFSSVASRNRLIGHMQATNSLMFQNLSLLKRLLLALVPAAVIAVPVAIGYVSGNYPIPQLVAGIVYCALFGGFIMVPFIASQHRIVLRVLVLILMPPAFFYLVTLSISLTESLTNNWSLSESSILAFIVAETFVFNLLNAVLLAIVAPLRTNRKFWGYVGLTGAVTGLLCAVLFHYFFCMVWCDWTELLMGIPLLVWPLLFCASTYVWRMQLGRETTRAH